MTDVRGSRVGVGGSLLALYLIAMAMNGFDATIVAPALPDMADGVGTDAHGISAVEWVFLVASAVVLPAAGWVARRFGTTRVFVATLAVFTLGCAWAAVAGSLLELSIARAIQGAASGLLTPVGLAMVYTGASGADRLRIARVTTVPLTIAPMLGPVAGGVITEQMGWRGVFGVLIPLGLIATALAVVVDRSRETARSRDPFDLKGFSLFAVGVGGLMLLSSLAVTVISRGAAGPLQISLLAGLAVATVSALVLAVRVARSTAEPAVDLMLWHDRAFRWGGAVIATGAAALMGLLYLVPLLLRSQGAGPGEIGLALFPETIGVLLGAPLLGPLRRAVGTRALAVLGTGVAGGAALTLVLVGWTGSPWTTGALMLVFGVSLSQPMLLGQAASFATLSPNGTADATALFMMQRTVVGSLGVLAAATPLALLTTGDAGWYAAGGVVLAWLALSIGCVLRLTRTEWVDALAEPPMPPED